MLSKPVTQQTLLIVMSLDKYLHILKDNLLPLKIKSVKYIFKNVKSCFELFKSSSTF